MNKRISLNGSDWLLKEFYGEKDPPRMLVLRLGSFGKPDSIDTCAPSQIGRTKNRRTKSTEIETATASANRAAKTS